MLVQSQYNECKICGGRSHKLLFTAKDLNYGTTNKEFNIVKCKKCKLVHINPLPVNLEQYYPELYGPHQQKDNISIKPSIETVLSLFYNYPVQKSGGQGVLKKICYLHKFFEVAVKNEYFFHRIPYERQAKILDIGCGNGSYLLLLKKLGWNAAGQLFGVEFPNESIAHIKKTEELNIIEGNFLNVELPMSFFSIATLRHVLEHFSDPVLAMRRVHDVLAPGGRVLISLPNFRSLETFLFKGKWYHIDAPRHLYHFTPATLKALLERTGFEMERIYLKKSVSTVTRSLENYGLTVSKSVEKYIISNILKISKLLGLSEEILCIAVKK
ncbi:MAG: class I SAM-dependent methyltransferase [Nitrospirota bacterium]